MTEPRQSTGRSSLGTSIERMAWRQNLLSPGESLIEWRQGELRRFRMSGADQRVAPRGPGPAPELKVSGCAYTPRYLLVSAWVYPAGSSLVIADLAFILRIWCITPRTFGAVYITDAASASLGSLRWTSDEREGPGALTPFTDRLRAYGQERRAEISAEWQEALAGSAAAVTASGLLDAEIRLLEAAPDA